MNINKTSWMVWLMKLQFQISNYEAHSSSTTRVTGEIKGWSSQRKGKIPNSLCPFFWKLVASLLLSIINIPGIIAGLLKFRRDPGSLESFTHPGVWTILQIVSLILGLLVTPNDVISSTSPWYAPIYILLGASILCILALIITTVVFGCTFIADFIKDYIKDLSKKNIDNEVDRIIKEDKPNILVEFYKAHKEKVCPTINFKE